MSTAASGRILFKVVVWKAAMLSAMAEADDLLGGGYLKTLNLRPVVFLAVIDASKIISFQSSVNTYTSQYTVY